MAPWKVLCPPKCFNFFGKMYSQHSSHTIRSTAVDVYQYSLLVIDNWSINTNADSNLSSTSFMYTWAGDISVWTYGDSDWSHALCAGQWAACILYQLRIEGHLGVLRFWSKFCNIMKHVMNLKFETIVQSFRKIIQLYTVNIFKATNEY